MDINRQDGVAPAVVSGVLAVVLWFALVPHTDADNAEARVPAFWCIMVGVAAVLGVAFGRQRALIVAATLSVPQFVLAFWTAPRGDNDGLWVLWMPLLLLFGAFLLIPAWAGGWLRDRLSRPQP